MKIPDDPRLAPLDEREAADTAGGLSLLPFPPFEVGPFLIPLDGETFPRVVPRAIQV